MAKDVKLNIRMDAQLKNDMERICDELGITISTLVTMLGKKMVRENRIPFDLSLDPFYSKPNMDYINKQIEMYETGNTLLVDNPLIDEE